MNEPEGYISLSEAAKIAGYSAGHIRRLCVSGKLPARKVGKTWLTLPEDVRKLTQIQATLPLTLGEIAGTALTSYSYAQKLAAISLAVLLFFPVLGNFVHLPDRISYLSGKTHAVIVATEDIVNQKAQNWLKQQLASLGIGSANNPSALPNPSASPLTLRGDKTTEEPPLRIRGGEGELRSAGQVLGTSTTTVSNQQVIDSLRTILVSGLLPDDIKASLQGPQGPMGPQGPAGSSIVTAQYIPNSGSVFGITAPTASPQSQGTIGSASNLSSQNFSSNKVTVTEQTTLGGSVTINAPLTVTGSLSFSGNLTLTGDLLAGTDNTYHLGSSTIRWSSLHTGPTGILVHNDITNTNKVSLIFSGSTAVLGTDAATPLQLTTGSNSGIYISSDGRVGIGTTAPLADLLVQQSGHYTSGLEIRRDNDVTPSGNLIRATDTAGTADFFLVDAAGNTSLTGNFSQTGNKTFSTGTGNVTFNNVTTNFAATNPIIDLTSASTLNINTTTNRPVMFGTGMVTIPNLTVTNSQSNNGTMVIDSAATTATIFEVIGNSMTSGTAIKKTITANAGNGQTTHGEILNLTDSTTAGGGFTGIGITVTGAGTGSGTKYLLDLNPNTANNEVVFDNNGAFRPTTAVASNTATIGSTSFYFKNGYFDQITANNIAGTVAGGATSSTTWTIGSTQVTDVNESLIFYRNNLGAGNATLQWNAGAGDLRYLTANYPFNATYTVDDTSISTSMNLISGNLTNNTTAGTQKLLSLTNTGTGTTEDGLYIANTGTATTAIELNGTFTNALIVPSGSGNVGLGITNPDTLLTVAGPVKIQSDALTITSGVKSMRFGWNGDTFEILGTEMSSGPIRNLLLSAVDGMEFDYNTGTLGWAIRTTGDFVDLGTHNLTVNGKVGAGTANPDTTLDVNGVTTFRGNIIAGTDNTYDIGANGATRPRTGYFGTSVISPLFNGLAITNNGTNTLNIAAGKTLTASDSTTLATNAITLGGGEVVTFSPTNALSLLTTAGTSVTLPTSGTLVSSVTTGNGVSAVNTAGALAFTLGAITPSTVNGNTFTTGSSTYTGTAGQTYTFPTTTATIARTDAGQTFTGNQVVNGNITFTDNTYDIGASGATRPRTGYFGTSIVVPTVNATTGMQINGGATTGTVLRGNGTDYVATTSTFADTYTASNLLYSNGANTVTGLATGNNGVLITSGTGVPSISSTLPSAVQGNITAVGTLASGAIPASLVTAGTFGTGAYIFPSTLTTTTSETVPTVIGGTAAGSSLTLQSTSGVGTTDAINFQTGSQTTRWTINTSGHFIAGTDNTYDIGASGATRPRTGYFGTSLISPLFNGLAITNNGTNTLNIAAGKTLTASDSTTLATNAITLGGGEVITFSPTNALSILTTAGTSVTLPTSGTLVSSVTTGNGVSAVNTAGALAFTLGAITPSTVNALTLASQAVGFTIAGGTTSKTLTVPLDASVSGTNTGDNAANSSTMFIGTTSQALNRASASEGLSGITSLTPGADFTLNQNSVAPFTSVSSGAVANTLYLTGGNVGIGVTNPTASLQISSSNTFGTWMDLTATATSGLNYRIQSTASGAAEGAGKLLFNSGTNTNIMTFSSGNVGIGTTGPGYKLEVDGTLGQIVTTSGNKYILDSGASDVALWGAITNNSGGTPGRLLYGVESTAGATITGSIANSSFFGTNSATPLHFIINGGIKATIDTSGNLGIGTTGPTEFLHVEKNQNADTRLLINNTDAGVSARAGIILSNSSSSTDASIYMTGNNYTGIPYWTDSFILNSGTSASGGIKIRSAAGGIGFSTDGGTTTSNVFINTSGNVGIGTTSPGSLLTVNGAVAVTPAGNGTIQINTDNNRFRLTGNASANYIDSGYDDATGSINFRMRTAGTPINAMTILGSGNVGIGTTNPTSALVVGSGAQFLVDYSATSSAAILSREDLGNNRSGPYLFVGGNSNAGTEGPAAGTIRFGMAANDWRAVWVDLGAKLRINSNPPQGSTGSPSISDTAGTVVGDQTSWYQLKNVIGEHTDANGALAAITNTKVYDFTYKDTSYLSSQDTPEVFTGVVIYDQDRQNNAWFAKNLGSQQVPALNELNVAGYSILGIQALNNRTAKTYGSAESLAQGDIVAFDEIASGSALAKTVKKADNASTAIGVVSSVSASGSEATSASILFVGQTQVKVSEEKGQIHAGDRLTLSDTNPGYAAKMTASGQSIGTALADSNGGTTGFDLISVMVSIGYQHIDVAQNTSGQLVIADSDYDFNGHSLLNVKSIASLSGKWSIADDGTLVVVKVKAHVLETETGVTIKDHTTGASYCVYVDNSVTKTILGACDDSATWNPPGTVSGSSTTTTTTTAPTTITTDTTTTAPTTTDTTTSSTTTTPTTTAPTTTTDTTTSSTTATPTTTDTTTTTTPTTTTDTTTSPTTTTSTTPTDTTTTTTAPTTSDTTTTTTPTTTP